ncbi:MAG: O-antigen ligase family protein [Lachnospiraceae bacterium]|nr:O-antigen ligase family protein [Lachnospiraceae bacterium]
MHEKEHDLEKLIRNQESETDSSNEDWHRDICQGILMAYFLVMAVVYPLYAPGGYMRIGEVKYEFFRNVSLVTLAVMAVVILLAILGRRDWEWIVRNYRRMSVTDWFAYGYFVTVMLSYLCSAYKEDAFWGADGWYMGAVTQMIFVLLYFCFSRYFHCDLRWMGIWLLAAAVVFLLGICNRYSVYPIAMEGQTDTFISTLGNINWFCGYWSVTAPIGIVWYWYSDSVRVRFIAGIYSVTAMLSGVTQGSNSAYLVFGAVFLALFILSLGDGRKMYRFLELCMMFAGSCQLGRILRYVPSLDYNYGLLVGDGGSRITMLLLDDNAALWGLLAAALCYVILRRLDRQNLIHIIKRRWLWILMSGTVIVVFCIAAILMMLDSGILLIREVPGTMEQDGGLELVFDEDWGNGRGATWNCGIDAYQSMDALHKIVGVGPDCFADYVYDVPELAQRLAERFVNLRLTNAHNEQITMLVNAGLLGWLCYAGIFLTAFLRYMRKGSSQPVLYLCAVSILAYVVHNMVSFQQVLNTPYVFIVIGIGERFCRNIEDAGKSEY